MLTTNLRGREVSGAIHGDEQRAIDRAIGLQVTQVVEPIEEVGKQGKELFGRDRVEEIADVVIRGDLGHLEQGRGVTAAFGQRHVSLKLQKRSALCEKDRKPAERRVYHCIVVVVVGAYIHQIFEHRAHLTD
jgi:hypothetical protein